MLAHSSEFHCSESHACDSSCKATVCSAWTWHFALHLEIESMRKGQTNKRLAGRETRHTFGKHTNQTGRASWVHRQRPEVWLLSLPSPLQGRWPKFKLPHEIVRHPRTLLFRHFGWKVRCYWHYAFHPDNGTDEGKCCAIAYDYF